jgi:hypothetical protein
VRVPSGNKACLFLESLHRDAIHPSIALILLLPLLACSISYAHGDPTINVGEAIYRDGILGSGKPLKAIRNANMRIEGKDTACVNCHRRSGFGSKEGRISIPPITGLYLFHQRARRAEDQDLPFVESMRTDHDPYSDETLARAIREGLNSENKPLNYLMPKFDLDDADMAALIDYLKHLDKRKSAGVTDTVLHFATIITPDADPIKTQGMLDVLKQFFADRNARQRGPAPHLRSSGKTAYSKMMFKANRIWELHVWKLSGAPSTWKDQLKQYFTKEPVLAVVSGIGGTTWAPVHEFCEQEPVPCLFPNVELPPANADHDFYSLYFSKGVELEVNLMAKRILNPANSNMIKEMQQVYREGDIGEAAAMALAAALENSGIKVRNQIIPIDGTAKDVAKAVQKTSGELLVLWLRPDDIANLGSEPAVPRAVFMSGLMGGLERSPLPSGWRPQTLLTYPVGLPKERIVNVDFASGWFAIRHIPVVDLQIQADTYLACGLLAETLSHMVDTFVPDYLVERIEDNIGQRIITGYYPRLTLAQGQRFASKGGYFVRFADINSTRVVAESDWIVP